MVLAAGCGGTITQDTGTTTVASDTTTTAPPATDTSTTEAPSTTEDPDPDSTTRPTSDRPVAPDFSLELGDGGVYTLSEGEKPVYLVFWAEW